MIVCSVWLVQDYLAGPGRIGCAVGVKGKFYRTIELIAPHDTDMAVEGDKCGDIIRGNMGIHTGGGHNEWCAPLHVRAEAMAHVDVPRLGIGDPEATRGVLVDHNR